MDRDAQATASFHVCRITRSLPGKNPDYDMRLAAAGVAVERHVLPGAFHGFDLVPASLLQKARFARLRNACARLCPLTKSVALWRTVAN
jgi:acetyl esterase/lipase